MYNNRERVPGVASSTADQVIEDSSSNDPQRPLTSPQREVWFEQVLQGEGSPLYNIGGYMRLEGPLDVTLFRRSAQLLVLKHDVLRTALVAGDEGDVPQQAWAHLTVDVPLHDFSSANDPLQAAMAWMQQRFDEPFLLYGEPLFRYALLQLGPTSFLYFGCYHHLIADGWTIALLTRSHGELYTALLEGREPDLTAPSYQAFVDNDQQYQASRPSRPSTSTGCINSSRRPSRCSRRATAWPAGHAPSRCNSFTLPRPWYDRLSAFAQSHGATTFHALLAAVYVYFTRIAGRHELTLGLPVLNRANAAFKATAGLFVGVTATHLRLGPDLSFPQLMQAIGRELRQDYRHQRFPISTLNRELGRLGAGQQQLFDVGLSYERHDYAAAFGDIPGTAIPLVNQHQTEPLMLYVREFHADANVQLDFVHHLAYFSSEDIQALQPRLMTLLDAALDQPQLPLACLPVLAPQEVAQITAWNATGRPREEADLLDRPSSP